jgi:hypothetical protein
MDEEAIFERIMRKDETVQATLELQQRIWEGQQGSKLLVLSKSDGKTQQTIAFPDLVRFDGLAVANGRVFASTVSGVVRCWGPAAE